LQIKTKIVSCHTADSKPVKQEVNGTVICPLKYSLVRPIEYATIYLSFEEVAVHAGKKVLVKVDNNILLIVGNSQGILD
jgi:hypothetical protein